MRSKEEIMKEVSQCEINYSEPPSEVLQGENEYLFLEVLIDIRDQLAEVAKLRYAKLGNSELVYSRDDE